MELSCSNLKKNSYIFSYFLMTADEAAKRKTNCKNQAFVVLYGYSKKFK